MAGMCRKYYDMVILGASFSADLESGWQNYVVRTTGVSVIYFGINRFTVDDILGSQAYRDHPPVVFVYEMVERNLIARHSECETGDEAIREHSMRPRTIPWIMAR